jgi:hypothetical protein
MLNDKMIQVGLFVKDILNYFDHRPTNAHTKGIPAKNQDD